MGTRRRAREAALQLLYGMEFAPEPSPAAIEAFWLNFLPPKEVQDVRAFAERLVRGVLEHREIIDQAIRDASTNWRLERMALVDRNILRIATYELHHVTDIPVKVSLNEAIEIAKRYGSEDSGSFINGILDRISSVVTKP